MLVQQGALVGALYFFNDLRHAIRAEEGRTFAALEFAHLLGNQGALVEQGQQLLVQGVDLGAQHGQVG